MPTSRADIINGSFELPGVSGTSGFGPGRQQYSAGSSALTGWTVSGFGDVFLHRSPDIGNNIGGAFGQTFNNAQDGHFYLDLSGSFQNGAHAQVSQDVATMPFTTYRLSFYIGASSQQPPAPSIHVAITGLESATSFVQTTLTPHAPLTNINWSLQSFTFVANSATTRVSFQDVIPGDDNASFVDNVSLVPVSPVPAPPAAILAAVGFGGLAGYRRWKNRRCVPQTAA
jgi:hypothetical protein